MQHTVASFDAHVKTVKSARGSGLSNATRSVIQSKKTIRETHSIQNGHAIKNKLMQKKDNLEI